MYPSIIIENNICFTTLNDKGSVVSPTGVRFLDKSARAGLLPQILGNLMRERKEVKAKLKAEADAERRAYYDRLQFAIKILMNAFYGVLASSFYRFTNPDIGASITAFARENIKGIIQQLESDGVRVIYADTDSVFFESPHKELAKTVDFGRVIAERFSHGSVNMEFERVLETFFSHGKKKRYAAKTAWPIPGELIVRGYEIRRTDAFELQSTAQRELFDLVLNGNTEEAVERAKSIVQEVKGGIVPEGLANGDPTEALVISRTVKEEGLYVNPGAMTNLRAFKKLKDLGYEVVPGMKVSWIVTDGRKTPQEVEPFVSGRPFTAEPDWEYYARRLAQTLGYITEVYGWDEKALVAGALAPKQVTLDRGGFEREDSGSGEVPAEETPRRSTRKQTLEDFF